MMKLISILAFALLAIQPAAAYVDEYKEAVRLYEKNMLNRSRQIFDEVADQTGKADPAGYSLLCDIRACVPGYANRMEVYLDRYPYSSLVQQIRFHHALNLFDAEDYKGASEQFSMIEENKLYKVQRIEYLFKSAYCELELGNVNSAKDGFLEVEKRKLSDFTAPSRYGLGYVEYNRKNFKEAIEWFEKSAKDNRFTEMAGYYILECRFLLKDYAYVIEKGQEMFASAPSDRKAHLARIISESYFVKDDVENAKKFYEHTLATPESENTRADWFYRGSVLYAVKDYKGAIANYVKMGERRDSIGQVASYNLGYSYIQTKDKVSALGAFRNASELSYDAVVAEDAMFNYAKLSFDLNSDISVFNEYLRKYSDARKGDRIYSYIAVAGLLNHDYEAAVEAYDKIDDLDEDMRLNYMKANYLRANQLIRNGSYRRAVPCLKAAAYDSDKKSAFNQLSRYWLAESYYRDDQYAQARNLFSELYNVSALDGKPESYLIPYNIAYCYFKEENYAQAGKWFDEYLSGSSVKFRKEALVRRADCVFVTSDYPASAAAYDKVLADYYNVNDIYPYYQAALSYGLAGNYDRKVELLSGVFDAAPESEFYPEALFELGRTYAVKEDDENAFNSFNKLASSVKDSTFVAMAYIEMGTLARNQSMFNEALGYYKVVVEQMPLSEYADDALLAIESIYQTKNEAAEYLAYIDSIGKGEIKSDEDKENMIFNSAEQVFLSENYQKALVALEAYLDKYPNGANVFKADFYIAESYRALGKYEQACDSYKMVIAGGEGSFVELSMLNFANLSYRLERWTDALGGYVSLHDAAKLPNNVVLAMEGAMRAAYKGHQWADAVSWCDKVMANESCEADVKTEAKYVKAKSYLAVSRRDDAFAILKELSANVEGVYGAEAAYMIILDSYDRGDFESVKTKVYQFADAGTSQTYWLAKCFIVLGDSFVETDDIEQARATFESIRDSYTPVGVDDDVLDNVKFRLKKLDELVAQAQ